MNDHKPSRGRYIRGCRCDGCTQANRDYANAYNAARKAEPHTPTVWRYIDGCRCDGCVQANRDYMREYMRNYRKNGHTIKKTTPESQLAPGRLSVRPLLAAIDHQDDTTTAERCGVQRGQVVRWKREGMTLQAADRAACKLGYHPYTIWGRDYWHAK